MSAHDKELIETGQAALVAIRLNSPLSRTTTSPTFPGIYLAHTNTGALFKECWPVNSPNRAALDAGWRTVTLPPGHYLMLMHFPGSVAPNRKLRLDCNVQPSESYFFRGNSIIASLRFEVPSGGKTFYLGDIDVAFEQDPNAATKADKAPINLTEIAIESKSASRDEIAEHLGVPRDSIETSLLAFFPGEITETIIQSSWRIQPTPNPPLFKSRDWSSRSMSRFTGIELTGSPRSEPNTQAEPSDAGSLSGGVAEGVVLGLAPAITMVYIGYLPFGFVGGIISGTSDEGKYTPSIDAFSREIIELDLCTDLARMVREQRPDQITETGRRSDPPIRCEVEVLQVDLCECSDRKTFAVEIHAAAHWYDNRNNDLLFERYWVSTSASALARQDEWFRFWPPGAPYEQNIYSQPCRPITDLAELEIAAVMLSDTKSGIQAIADSIANIGRTPVPVGIFPSKPRPATDSIPESNL